METRLGHDLARVRVHDDATADSSAQGLGALAFTVGDDVFFGAGRFAPHTGPGHSLLAHELTHVIQQAGGARSLGLAGYQLTAPQDAAEREADAVAASSSSPIGAALAPGTIARKDAGQYETGGVELAGSKIAEWAKRSYWEQKVAGAFKLSLVEPVTDRFKADTEERDAVLAALWSVRPAKLTAETEVTVAIPTRSTRPKSAALMYKFTFSPPVKAGQQAGVTVAIVASGEPAKPVAAGAAPAGYRPPDLSMDSEGFPDTRDEYWKRHPGEHAQLYHWIEAQPDGSIDRVVTTEETTTVRKKAVTHTSSYRVQGRKIQGKPSGLSVDLLGVAPVVRPAPAGYAEKDYADLQLEEAQTVADKKKKDKLGTVRGISGVPADERLPCKYAIWQYFESGTRNSEVDAIVPIGATGRSVLYTFRFGAGNDVDVARVGPRGTAAGQLDPTKLDIRTVRGYASNAADPSTLLSWLKRRYKAVATAGTTVHEITAGMNAKLRDQAGTQAWFSGNYDIHVLSASDGISRLQDKHHVPEDLTEDIINFTSSELKTIESTLGSFSEELLTLLAGTRLVRKQTGMKFDAKTKSFVPSDEEAGLTISNGGRTVLIFDRSALHEETLFVGGQGGVRPFSATTVAHEFGHVIEQQAGIKKAFYQRFGQKGGQRSQAAPPTWYAAKFPTTELFTEMFALYQTDPEWLRTRRPEIYAWLETLSTTGKPPP